MHILENKAEGGPGGVAEVPVGESDLDPGILCDELDAPLKEIQKIAGVANNAFYELVFGQRIDLSSVVFENDAKHLANSNENL